MNMTTKNDIFTRYLKEYLKASNERKSEILNHITDVTGMHRKACIRRFGVLQRINGKWGYVRYFLDLCVLILFTF